MILVRALFVLLPPPCTSKCTHIHMCTRKHTPVTDIHKRATPDRHTVTHRRSLQQTYPHTGTHRPTHQMQTATSIHIQCSHQGKYTSCRTQTHTHTRSVHMHTQTHNLAEIPTHMSRLLCLWILFPNCLLTLSLFSFRVR